MVQWWDMRGSRGNRRPFFIFARRFGPETGGGVREAVPATSSKGRFTGGRGVNSSLVRIFFLSNRETRFEGLVPWDP